MDYKYEQHLNEFLKSEKQNTLAQVQGLALKVEV